MSRNRCAAFNTDSNRHQRVCACRRGLLDSISRWGTRHRSQRLHTDRKAATRAASSPQTSERSSYLAVLLALLASDSPRMGLSGGLMLDNAVKAGRRFRPLLMSFNWQAASRPQASRPKMEKARPAPGQALPVGRWSGRGLRPRDPEHPPQAPSSTLFDTLRPTSCAECNLVLAARPRVGHIGLAGDVAEWLKAAVC